MLNLKKSLKLSLLSFAVGSLLVACGGGGGGGGSSQGSLSLAVTDAPVDGADRVVVEFTGVSIKPEEGEEIEFLFDEAKSIDLLALQGSLSEPLLTEQSVPAGNYEWIRLHVNASQDNVLDSFLEEEGGALVELRIPSGSQTGLKLVSGFTIAAGGIADFTIDFDLRKSLTDPVGQPTITLKPALRIVDNLTVGSIEGSVSDALVSSLCSAPLEDDGSVYLYMGSDITPVDMQGLETDPIASALVSYDAETGYSYEIGFVASGDYTVAYTCDAANDDPATAQTGEDAIEFSGAQNVTVVAEEAAQANFDVVVE